MQMTIRRFRLWLANLIARVFEWVNPPPLVAEVSEAEQRAQQFRAAVKANDRTQLDVLRSVYRASQENAQNADLSDVERAMWLRQSRADYQAFVDAGGEA